MLPCEICIHSKSEIVVRAVPVATLFMFLEKEIVLYVSRMETYFSSFLYDLFF